MTLYAWVPLGAVLAALAWGYFEAGWVRLRRVDVAIPGLGSELAGLRIVHLSDLHLGSPSRGERAVRRAVEWAAGLEPDLILVTGDLVSRPKGEPLLRELVRRLPCCYAILGNHDLALSRDPFSKVVELRDLTPATLLLDEGRMVELRGARVWIAGLDPRSRGQEPDLTAEADLRILLSHFPSCTTGRSAFRIRAGRCAWPICGRATPTVSTESERWSCTSPRASGQRSSPSGSEHARRPRC